MRPFASCAWLLCCASLSLATTARAQEEPPAPEAQLSAIRELVLHASYAEAASAVDAMLARTDLRAVERNAVLEAQVIILVARRQVPRAREVLAALFARDPGHNVVDRDAGPAVREEFDRARAHASVRATVTLEDDTEDTLVERAPPTLSVRVTEGADTIHEIRLSYRRGAGADLEQAVMRFDPADGTASANIPLAVGTEAYTIEYFVEALAPSGASMGTLGTSTEPLRLDVPEAPPVPVGDVVLGPGGGHGGRPVDDGSVLGKWWFWTIVGVVVAGGIAVGVGVGVAGDQGDPPGTLGTVRL